MTWWRSFEVKYSNVLWLLVDYASCFCSASVFFPAAIALGLSAIVSRDFANGSCEGFPRWLGFAKAFWVCTSCFSMSTHCFPQHSPRNQVRFARLRSPSSFPQSQPMSLGAFFVQMWAKEMISDANLSQTWEEQQVAARRREQAASWGTEFGWTWSSGEELSSKISEQGLGWQWGVCWARVSLATAPTPKAHKQFKTSLPTKHLVSFNGKWLLQCFVANQV